MSASECQNIPPLTTVDNTRHVSTIRALTSFNVSGNRISAEEMRKLIAIVESMSTMAVLCEVPFKNKTITELDLRGQNLYSDGAVVVGHYLENNPALTSLDVSQSALCGINVIDDGLYDLTHAYDVTGVSALADAIGKHP